MRAVYKYSCPDHGTSYGHGILRDGMPLVLEDDAVILCPEAEDGTWVAVFATQCERHGRWSENDVSRHWVGSDQLEVLWECPETGHWFITVDQFEED